jgi:hypothetical protein
MFGYLKGCLIILILILQAVPGQARSPKAFDGLSGRVVPAESRLPKRLKKFIESIRIDPLGGRNGELRYTELEKNLVRVSIRFELPDSVWQDDWKVDIRPAFEPTFHWSPHLTPTDQHIVAQHVFRAPALIMANGDRQISVVPDLSVLAGHEGGDWYMDMDAQQQKLSLGMSASAVQEHVLFVRKEGAEYPPGRLDFAFYILVEDRPVELFNPWNQVRRFMWDRWGKEAYDAKEKKDLLPYVKQTYDWAFRSWKEPVWQEFEVGGKRVGAPTFIVNVTQSPNYTGPVHEREFRSVWNQAWFSSLRSAQGLFRYARQTGDQELMDYARKTKELALSFPQREGFFPGLVATEMELVHIEGRDYHRSKGWDHLYWGNSNRNPYSRDARTSPFHILDMSITAELMLDWYRELEKDERLLDYARSYAEALLALQDSVGFFPAWLSADDLQPYDILARSPETSASVTFLLKLYEITGELAYRASALKALRAVTSQIVGEGRWEDFETYWSCSPYGHDHLVGKKVARNNMYKQNTLSMFWTAKALLNAYELTGEAEYLRYGKRTLDELLMAQAIWQPPYIYVEGFGGFGVMNADGEWNDSRQSLFAELIVRYGERLGEEEYVERGLAALRASFSMMYSPQNPTTREQWEARWPFFNERDYGFMMENYGHDGVTNPHGLGIGEFTIYDWGNGAAAEAYSRMLDHYGKKFIFEN